MAKKVKKAVNKGLRGILREYLENKPNPREIMPGELVEYAKTKGLTVDNKRASMEKTHILKGSKPTSTTTSVADLEVYKFCLRVGGIDAALEKINAIKNSLE